jgi:hypothetical protein
MTSIFISYRRSDSADVSGRIYDRLVEHFGDEAIFKDVDDIPFGVDFKTYLSDVVATCDVELVIIGPTWLDVTNETGQRRLDDPTDFVRIEVEAALERDIPVVPLLVRGAIMPKGSALPPGLSSLTFRNGTPIRPDPDFHHDMNRLIKGLEQYVSPQSKPAAQVRPAPAASTPTPHAPPSPPRERVFYEQSGDKVTSSIARIGDTSFAISDILSAAVVKVKPSKKEKNRVTTISAATFFVLWMGTMAFAAEQLGFVGGLIVLFTLFGIHAAVASFYPRPKQGIQIQSTVGDRDVVASQDPAHLRRIVSAINEAKVQMR